MTTLLRRLLLLITVAGCTPAQLPLAAPPQPQVQYYLPLDADWVVLSEQLAVRREGRWNQYGDNRHYWAKIRVPDSNEYAKGGHYIIYEEIANCANRTNMILTAARYAMKNAQLLGTWNAPVREMNPAFFEAIIPDSVGERAFNFVCQPPEAR